MGIKRTAWILGVFAMTVSLSAQVARTGLNDLIESVLRNGKDGQLPPHLSLVLGLGTGDAPLGVKQAVLREGHEVRVFNVSIANHQDIIILRTDEQDGNTQAYLISASGKLRKAVSYHVGAQTRRTPTSEARAASAEEIKFWLGQRQHGAPIQ
jgi:hypothetical protein